MGKETGISWADHTFNPWSGCVKVSEACRNCYAERDTKRWGKELWGPKGTRELRAEAYWRQPEKWDQDAEMRGERRRVFCMSMGDFWEDRPELEAPRRRALRLMEECHNLDWLILSKRPELAPELLARASHDHWMAGEWPQNVWAGVTAETQKDLDKRWPHLAALPAPVRFLSCEPLLDSPDLSAALYADCDYCEGAGCYALGGKTPLHEVACVRCAGKGYDTDSPLNELHWVICGGESGPKARPMRREWPERLQRQCKAAGVAFHFKQWGEYVHEDQASNEVAAGCKPLRPFLHSHNDPEIYYKPGTKATGRSLRGAIYSEVPKGGH